MPDYLVKEINNKETWENFVLANNPKSFLQSWNWGETNRLTGSKIYRLGFYNQRKLVGICLAIKQKAKRGTHLLIPGGPIINWKDKILVNVFIDYLKQISKREKAWFVRLRPELLDTKENRELLKEFGFISSPIHLHAENTWVLGIKPDSEQLLMAMRKSTRYLIRKSLKENLRLITTKDKKDTKILSKLQKETVE